MVFMDPSLRTRTSFETAMFLHGGHGGRARAGQGELVAGDRARRGDGRRHGRAHHRRRAGARPLRGRAWACAAFPAGSDWAVARRGRHRPQLRQVLREAGHQPRERAAAPLPGAGRRDDAAREAGRDRRQAVRAHLGLAPQGAAHRRARERRARRRRAGHGDRDRPAAGLRARSRRTRRSSGASPSSTAASSSTSSTIPTTRPSAPTRCT